MPLQLGAYWVGSPTSPYWYMVVDCSCNALAFGLTTSQLVWTKVVKVLARAMRARGIVCHWYIDNCFLCLPMRADTLAARDLVESLFVRSGLTRAPDKDEFHNLSLELQDHLCFFISAQGQYSLLKVPDM